MSDDEVTDRIDEILEEEGNSLSTENAETKAFEYSVNVKLNSVVYGDVCDCGYIPTGEHQSSDRIATWKCKLKSFAHRLRHPFNKRTDFQEHLDELKTATGYLDGPSPFPDMMSWEFNHEPREKDE